MVAGTDDTIVAASSPPGRSTRGLIRISGPATRRIAASLLSPPPTIPRVLTACRLSALSNDSVDTLPVLAALFAAPRTYTGQDMLEVQAPGNAALLERVIRGAVAQGARLAEAGEFTFRAFVAGKLDLTQAEGVAATIAATSDSQFHAAAMLREGKLGRVAAALVDALATQLALVEAGIDFVDQDDVVPIPPAKLLANLGAIAADLDDVLRRSRSWSALEALPRVVLAGPPSAGKSTLFNALLGRTRAVISPTPGTTRDALEEPLTLIDGDGRPIEVMLVDIAGLDEATSLLDRQAQSAARHAIERADLVLEISDGSASATRALGERRAAAKGHASRADHTKTMRVLTKIDQPPNAADRAGIDAVVSALRGTGLDTLRALIMRQVSERGVSLAADTLALQPRHEHELRGAASQLQIALSILTPHTGSRALPQIELLAGSLRAALDHLAGLGGQMTPDDVIGKVFATFCIGK